MKKIKLKSSLTAGLASLLLLFPNFRTGSLKDITKPYLGVYECKEAKLGDDDCLDRFSYIHIELKTGGEFIVYYCEEGGKKRQEKGRYLYDKENGTITLTGGTGDLIKREFPLKEGVLLITVRMGTKTLSMRFEQK